MIPTIILTMTVTFCNLQHENKKTLRKLRRVKKKNNTKMFLDKLICVQISFRYAKKYLHSKLGI